MEKGSLHAEGRQEPLARLLQEEWRSDGTIAGILFERIGRDFREIRYRGVIRSLEDCRVLLERRPLSGEITARLDAEVVLDPAGRPHYSLNSSAGATVTGIWRRQESESCGDGSLSGTVLSEQQGLSWGKEWRPNAVVQREIWSKGRVQGVAVSSYAGALRQASYTGSVAIDPDCQATIIQRDSDGDDYNYRAIVMADGSGYLYLQTDPDDLTVGWLEKVDAEP